MKQVKIFCLIKIAPDHDRDLQVLQRAVPFLNVTNFQLMFTNF